MNNISSGKKNKHLNTYERNKIEALRGIGSSISQIALQLGRAQSTIYREIKRGTVEFLDTLLKPYDKYTSYHADIVYRENRN